jgi:sialic acid synthase SpsE
VNEITLPSGRKIGPGQPTFIIAEIGSNWLTLKDCKNAIVQAKACGADAVKFQLFDEKALYGRFLNFGWQPGQLDPGWLPELAEKAKAVGIEFMCTAFSPELIDAVDPHVTIHKVASSDCTHIRMLERLASIGKPVILSTGAHGPADIRAALEILGDTPTVLMYCVAAYPAREIDLGCIEALRSEFRTLAGYSDHSTDALCIPLAAARAGACVLEKHVTFIDAGTPDSPHSLDAGQFCHMVSALRGERHTVLGPTQAEKGMILRHNRRLIATQDIPEGGILRADPVAPYQPFDGGTDNLLPANFGIFRSLKDETHAFHPFYIDHVDGKIAKRAIKAGDGIGPGDI